MAKRAGRLAAAASLVLAGALSASTATAHASEAHEDDTTYQAQVVAGRPATPNRYPSTVALIDTRAPNRFLGQFCGGSLIASDWVLTAAHCVDPPGSIEVLAGTTDLLDPNPIARTVTEIVVHPRWDPEFAANDLALIRLAQPITDIAPLGVIRPGQEALWRTGTVATLVGWGGLTPNQLEQQFPSLLQEANMPVVDDATCDLQLGASIGGPFDRTTMLCAGAPAALPNGGPDACNGDSGGPLMVRDERNALVQIGIVSWGPTCGITLTAYTRLVSYRGWIDDVLAGETPRSFPDVAAGPHSQAIEAVAAAGIATGYPDGTYRPGQPVTRGQMATFLARAFELPAGATAFNDIADNSHRRAIDAVASAGIATGFADGTFRPDDPVTRGQMATFLARAFDLPSGASAFTDIAGNPHHDAIEAVASAGIATGFPDGTFRPGHPVTRAQMATFLYRALLA